MQSPSEKREKARKMKEEYDKLTPQQKIDKLDKKLGVGIGAVKQRARILNENDKMKGEQK